MAEFQEAFRHAAETNHQPPPWANTQTQLPPNLNETTQRAIDIYLLSEQPNGEIGGIGWWQTANGYTAIALHDHYSHSNHNYQRLADGIRKCESNRKGLINEFNDDTLWWAMACLHVYALGRDPWLLHTAKAIWQHIRAKNSVCGRGQVMFQQQDMEGACFWTTREDEGQINSISSGLYVELSARLAVLEASAGLPGDHTSSSSHSSSSEKHPHLSKLMHLAGVSPSHNMQPVSHSDYLSAAHCSLAWILRCLYRPADGIVLDGILLKANEKRDWAFTYLTGQAIGACTQLYAATNDANYLSLAIHMAHKGMRNPGWVVPETGVLHERGAYGKGNHDPMLNDDAVTFKQVLVRHVGNLYEVMRRSGEASGLSREKLETEVRLIRTFVEINFANLLANNTNGNGQFGPWWEGPFECPTSHSQLAVLDVMATVRLVAGQ
jgi:predicted alpha-1,6-mannanase (GH76 family)